MTCIIGLAVDGEVFIGGDSCGTVDEELCLVANGKIFERGVFPFGCSGSRRIDETIRYNFDPPEVQANLNISELDRLMATVFADTLRAILKKNGALTIESGVETFDGTCLVGLRGRLYFVSGSFSVTPILDDFWATGSGAKFALGSLRSTRALPPRKRIELALTVASYYAEGVRAPFRILPAE